MLTLRNAQATVERALLKILALGARRRLPPVADASALRAEPTRGAGATGYARHEDDVVYVTGKASCYQWSTFSTEADDGDQVIKPADAGATGRWLKASSSAVLDGVPLHQIQQGTLKAVLLHEGDSTPEDLDRLLFGQRPAVVVRYLDDAPTPESHNPGALYTWRWTFDLYSTSANFRHAGEGARGSALPSESADDPGVLAIDGLVMTLLAGSGLGGLAGVQYCELGAGRMERADLLQRRFAKVRRLTVLGSVNNVSNDVDLTAVDTIRAQPHLTSLNADADFDPENHVVEGISVTPSMGLTQSITAGSAMLAGSLVEYAGEAYTFWAWSDTYLDLQADGTIAKIVVGRDLEAPSVTSGALRVGVAMSDAGGVDFRRLASTSTAFGDAYSIPKP